MDKYEVSREFTKGLIIALTAGYSQVNGEHQEAGYKVGYELRKVKRKAVNDYLSSIGLRPMKEISLQSDGGA